MQARLIGALDKFYKEGTSQVTASMVAERLWPDSRNHNANGQSFNLCAGVAGRMLRRCKAVIEVDNRVWEIQSFRLNQLLEQDQ